MHTSVIHSHNTQHFTPGVLADRQIATYCLPYLQLGDAAAQNMGETGRDQWQRANAMIYPFLAEQVRYVDAEGQSCEAHDPGCRRIISRGLSSAGYDIGLSPHGIKIFTNINSVHVDAKNFDERCLASVSWDDLHQAEDGSQYVLLPPNSYMLGHSLEYFRMPRDVIGTCLGKSTYARTGVAVNVTPLEPGWEGHLVVEIHNYTSLPQRIYVNEGIAQLIFAKLSQPCETSYADRSGKYQGQTGTAFARV